MPRRIFYAFALALLAACQAWAQSQAASTRGAFPLLYRQEERVRAPELEGGRGWLNTDAPLSLAALRGKVVLLDFWTYGCVNCMHVIPDLRRLEEKYRKELVVIGVHSAKFENEKETENIRRIVLRYGIEHPVVNDADFKIWNAYAVRAWPTLVLIDPAGYVVGKASGEGHYDLLNKAVGDLVKDARTRGTLNEQPLKLALERAKVGDLPLAFPGKILADAAGGRLFIADTGHNRVVVTRLDGTLLYTIGSGERGLTDGGFGNATFQRPQGLALEGDSLYIADTDNHLIRRADLKELKVETAAGTGEQSRDYTLRGGPARKTPLSSPWDLTLVGRALYVAMAGPHQLWKFDLDKGEVSLFAGTGREARADGRRLGEIYDDTVAAFAQPSGLASDGETLYVADAESNVIRAVALGEESKSEGAKLETASLSSAAEEVRTLAGGDLFEFGDRDGEGDDVRLQHPLGLALEAGRLFVADTYNHKIKALDPRTRKVTTFAGNGRPGQSDGERASFYEPGGLSVARGRLYVADTNNHAVRVVDLSTRRTTTLVIRGLKPPAPPADARDETGTLSAGPNASELSAPAQQLAVGEGGSLVFDVTLPEGHHVNTAAPNRYNVFTEEGRDLITYGKPPRVPANATPAHAVGVSDRPKEMRLPLRIDLDGLAPGRVSLRAELTLYYCREDDTGVCRVKTLVWRVPVEVTTDAGAPREIRLRAKVE